MKEDTDRVTVYIKQMVASLSNRTQYNFKIFKVADHLRQVKAKDYEPKIVAIGPYHEGKEHLMNMEKHKVRYLQQLLDRRDDLSIDMLVQAVWEMKEYAVDCYPDLNPAYIDMDKFVRTLLLDGCFVTELIMRYTDDCTGSSRDRDPILKYDTLSQIIPDLLLLENQLPFKILNMLIKMTHDVSLLDVQICDRVLYLVRDVFQWSNIVQPNVLNSRESTDHFLGLVYQLCFPSEGEVRKGKNSCINKNSASELTEAGIQLKPCMKDSLSLKGRVLEIPSLQVSVKTETLVRNLMAYEQLCLGDDHPKHVTGYVFFMHSLIRSTKDAEILKRSGIISNFLGGDSKVYHMLDRLVTNFLWTPYGSSDVFEKLNAHCGRRRVKWMANLWRDYFNNPWSFIKFLAALLLLGITIAQFAIAAATFKHSEDAVKVHLV